MLVNCKSCQKKFTVPDSAITVSGRLLQCGSCGDKWTQYPTKENVVKKIENAIPTKTKRPSAGNKIKTLSKKRKINLYSEEYLRKKHGLDINNPINNIKIKKGTNKDTRTNFGFFSYLVIISIFIVMLFGILNLSKEVISINYPDLKPYINYIYEVFDIIRILTFNLISNLKFTFLNL